MPMTVNGVSTTTAPGQEQYAYFHAPRRPGKPPVKRVQYDYRDTDGKLFSCCADTLEDARAKRDNWLARKDNELEG